MKRRFFTAAILLTACFTTGCTTPIGVRLVDRGSVRHELSADAISANTPSIASRQVLLRHGMADRMFSDPESTLAELHSQTIREMELDDETTNNRLFALSEYSYLHASKLKKTCRRPVESRTRDPRRKRTTSAATCEAARPYYVAASIYAYAFVFPDDERKGPGPLDPRLRTAVDLYNLAVTSAIKTPIRVEPRHASFPFHLGQLDLEIDPDGLHYAGRILHDFVPAAQLAVRGLRNRYRSPGIGAPFVADPTPQKGVEIPLTSARVAENLRVPVTIFVRYENLSSGLRTGHFEGRVEFYTEGRTTEIEIDGQKVPLEYETSAALAYSLQHSKLWDFEISGFRRGDAMPTADGLTMLSPYRPGRIPIVLVHGTASSPARWAEMINEIHSDPVLRGGYQIWIFMYATGNPILYSAGLLRESLDKTLAEIDPQGKDPALRRMVVIGHSQGGLLTKLQAITSGDRFWAGFADVPFEEAKLKPQTRELLERAVFFEDQEFVERVVFISTPHRGSFLAGRWMGRIASSLFTAPKALMGVGADMARAGVSVAGRVVEHTRSGFGLFDRSPDDEIRSKLARLPSSVDNMDPKSSFIQVLQSIPVVPRVHAHSIIPVKGDAPPEGQNDGVVEYSSAHIDEAKSEHVVYRSEHSTQANPDTIQEVRRILLEHLEQD